MTTFTVPEGVRRERADKVLAHAFPEHSRGAFQRVLEAGLVLADGQVIAQDQEVKSGQVLEFSFPATTLAELKPVDIPLDVIYEDRHLIVLNKAAGMVVHKTLVGGDGWRGTIYALLMVGFFHFARKSELTGDNILSIQIIISASLDSPVVLIIKRYAGLVGSCSQNFSSCTGNIARKSVKGLVGIAGNILVSVIIPAIVIKIVPVIIGNV